MKNIFKYVGIYEIVSGFCGIILILISLDFTSNVKIQFSLLSLVLFALVSYAGLLLHQEEKKGYILSIIAQLIQILTFNKNGIKYVFCSGMKLNVGYSNTLDFDFAFLSEEFILGLRLYSETFIYINLMPLFIFILLINRYSKE